MRHISGRLHFGKIWQHRRHRSPPDHIAVECCAAPRAGDLAKSRVE